MDHAKRLAACAAVDHYVTDGMALGIGSGSTIVFAVQHLAQKVRENKWAVVCVATSFQAKELILEHKLPLVTLDTHPVLDLVIDGADEIDEQLNLIKGGGGCQTQEKIVAFNSKRMIVIGDYTKESKQLGQNWRKGVPIEVIPMSYVPLMRLWEESGGKPKLRMGTGSKMGPCVTDNGNFIVDVDFGPIANVAELQQRLCSTPGVVETGLFVNMAEKAFLGLQDGSVKIIDKSGTCRL